MLKDTVETFKKKSLTRQRSAYAANLSMNNTTVNQSAIGDVSLVNQSAYSAIIHDPKIVSVAARQARIDKQECKKTRKDVIMILSEVLENRQAKVK